MSDSLHPIRKTNSRKWLWILGGVGCVLFTLFAICIGSIAWVLGYPSVSNTAYSRFSWEQLTLPEWDLLSVEEQVVGPVFRRSVITLSDPSLVGPQSTKAMRLMVYRPDSLIEGDKVPCIIIGGAGSRPFEGMLLGDGDQPEHLPYVHAGYVVVAFDIDGAMDSDGVDVASYERFRSAQGGLINARNAFEYARTQLPMVDPQKIFIAGHSSAGTLALLFAEHETRLAGAIAYAPLVDKTKGVPVMLIRLLSQTLPDLPEFLIRTSPSTHEAQLSCPLFLFHAEDDSNVSIVDSKAFVERIRTMGKSVEFKTATTGDHYDSMIDEGIPSALEWIKSLDH